MAASVEKGLFEQWKDGLTRSAGPRADGRRDGWTDGCRDGARGAGQAWGCSPRCPRGPCFCRTAAGARGCCGRSRAEPAEFSPKYAMRNPITNPRGQQHPRLGARQQGRVFKPRCHLWEPRAGPGADLAPGEPGWKAAAIRGILMAGRHGGAVPNSHGHNKDSTGRGVRICAERKKKKKKKVFSP